MENLRKRCNIQLVTDPERMLRLAARPTYVSHKIFHENLVAVHYKQTKLLMDKPSYVGMCILELSKTLMYDFITIISRKNILMQNYSSLILTPYVITSRQKTFILISSQIESDLITVIIPLIQNSIFQKIRKLLENSKMKLLEYLSENLLV